MIAESNPCLPSGMMDDVIATRILIAVCPPEITCLIALATFNTRIFHGH